MKPITVVKFGGSLSKDPSARKKFFADLAVFARRQPVVLVHGGGPEINSWLERLGITPKFVNGLRFTDAATLEIVEMALTGKVNKSIVAEMNGKGVKAVGVSGKDGAMLKCRRIRELGYVGEPVKTDVSLLRTLLGAGYLPVVSSLGFDAAGDTMNVNADAAAMAVAKALKAVRLILLTDVAGVLDENSRTIPCITTRSVPALIKSGAITGGMIPKIKACLAAVSCGTKEVWIIEGASGLGALKGTVIKK